VYKRLAVLIARVAFWSLGTSARGGFAYEIVVSQSTGALGALQMVMLALVAARLVHEEPLAGWDAFWFTRPYSRNALMAAKLLFAAGVFVALPLIADLVTLALYHGGVRAQAEAAPTFLASYVTWTLLLLALAAMTPSLSAFVLTIVAALVSVSLLIVVFVAAALLLSEPSTGPASRVEDPAPALAARLVVALTMLAVIVYQYRRRRWRTAAALAVAGLVAALAVPYLWPSAFERPFVPESGSWSPAATSPVVIDRQWRMQISRNSLRDGPPMRQVFGRVRLADMPRDFRIDSVDIDSTLTLPDRTVLRSHQREGMQIPVADAEWPGHLAVRRAALGDVTVVRGSNEGNVELWPALIALSERDYARAARSAGRLDATLRFDLTRTRLRGTLPVKAGAALDDGTSRTEIVSIERGADGLTVGVRRWKASSPIEMRQSMYFAYVLRNQSRREALTAIDLGRLPTPSSGDGSMGLFLFSLGSMTLGMSRDGFALESERFRYPNRIARPGESRTFDDAWFDDAELAVLETVYAGSVTRSVRIDDFAVPDEKAVPEGQ
jgi:hypothetical protein